MILYLPKKPYEIKLFEGMGRGLVAIETIPKGSLICTCEILMLSEGDTAAVESTSLKYYTFKVTSTQDCLVLGDGEIFNHDNTANVHYELKDVGGRLVMEFSAERDIPANEQLFINYTADSNVDLNEYFAIRSLI